MINYTHSCTYTFYGILPNIIQHIYTDKFPEYTHTHMICVCFTVLLIVPLEKQNRQTYV